MAIGYPEKVLSRPRYSLSGQGGNSPKIGEFASPLTTTLDMDDVYGGSSLCLRDYIAPGNDGWRLIPTRVIYLVKKGVHSTADG